MRSRAPILATVALLIFAGAPRVARAASMCTFDRGTTTCTSVVQSTTTGTHTAVSGCLAGPTGVPGRRERTFQDTYLVTVTTTTLSHGRHGPVYDSRTDTMRQVTSSTLLSDTCQTL